MEKNHIQSLSNPEIMWYYIAICGNWLIPVVPHKAVAEVSKIGNL